MGYNPQESLENTTNAMGTVLGAPTPLSLDMSQSPSGKSSLHCLNLNPAGYFSDRTMITYDDRYGGFLKWWYPKMDGL